MRTVGLPLTVLVVVVAGAARASPQYPGGGAQQEQDFSTFVPQQSAECPLDHACVYWQLCLNGFVNTAGIGLIDVRSPKPVPSNVSHPQHCEDVGKLCCRFQGTGPVEPAPKCPLHHLCVPSQQCLNGVINTSGVGLIDPRIKPVPCTSSDPRYKDVHAVCCKRPDPLPLEQCPGDHVCLPATDCTPSSAGGSLCYVNAATGADGVCCVPKVVDVCRNNRVCVTREQCTSQGTVNTDGIGIIDVRILNRCNLVSGGQGVCCIPPGPDPSVVCSDPTAVCSPNGYCDEQNTYIVNGYTETCYLGEGSGAVGQCCRQEPVKTCPGSNTCNVPDLCEEDNVPHNSKQTCELNNQLVGVCCKKKEEPVNVLDSCPHDSACLPQELCKGEILNLNNVYEPYGSASTWAACRNSASGHSFPGVCCKDTSSNLEGPAKECGVRNLPIDTRIATTKLLEDQAGFAEFPWMGIIFFTNFTYKCGASLVDDRWVITAAHCVHNHGAHELKVRLGEWQVDDYTEPGKYRDVNIAKVFVHPNFNSGNLFNDIAVLELATPVQYEYHINRICLPEPGVVLPAGTDCIATGWGKDAFDGGNYQVILKKVDLPVVENSYCQQLLRNTRLGEHFILDQSFVCAGGEEGKDACTGDGGGPLACLNPATNRYDLYGLTAWGIGCGVKDRPGVYANVPYLYSWVEGIIHGTGQTQQYSR